MFKRFAIEFFGLTIMALIGVVIMFVVSFGCYGIQEAINGREVDWKAEIIDAFTGEEDTIEVIEEGGVDSDSSFFYFREINSLYYGTKLEYVEAILVW